MERVILHVDCNKFYASVECMLRPELKNLPVAVGGNEKSRHGIILTKNEIASQYAIKTGEPLWSARQKCPQLIIIEPNFPLYMEISKRTREIYYQYTDLIEPFGLDEAWLDVTGSQMLFGNGEQIANLIREQIKREIGITVSVGVSFNKVFAKLGSDYKKPDATTIFSKENYKEIVWNLPANDMLLVGPATKKKLESVGIFTIGELANADVKFLKKLLGKHGEIINAYANGYDNSPVKHIDDVIFQKSFGNSTTTPRDLTNNDDVNMIFGVLSDSVARRMREQGVKGKLVTITVRDSDLNHFTRQSPMNSYTNLSREIWNKANEIFAKNYNWNNAIRSVGISVSDFEHENIEVQLDIMGVEEKREKLENLERTIDKLKARYGNFSIAPACTLKDTKLTKFNPHDDHTIHPMGYR